MVNGRSFMHFTDLYPKKIETIKCSAHNMVYNALATVWYGGYERMALFCILLIKDSAIQRQRHHTP
jgi:hypothetical protein